MSAERNIRGMNRIKDKLRAAMGAGNYYEALQMYRTLYYRYFAHKEYHEGLKFIYSGCLELCSRGQHSGAADLALLIIDGLEKAPTNSYDFQEWVQQLGVLIKNLGPNLVERETLINRAVKWSGDVSKNPLGYPKMHYFIAHILWLEGNTEQARHHFLLSKDGFSCGQILVEISQNKGYASEIDLFIAQVILQQLCLKETETALKTFETYTKYHPKIAAVEPPFVQPLLNFLFFLLRTIQSGRLGTFKSLCELYKASIDRDPSYEKYLQKIGVIFFGAPAPQQQGMGLIGNIFNRLFQGLDDDEEEERPANIPSMNSNLTTNNAELD